MKFFGVEFFSSDKSANKIIVESDQKCTRERERETTQTSRGCEWVPSFSSKKITLRPTFLPPLLCFPLQKDHIFSHCYFVLLILFSVIFIACNDIQIIFINDIFHIFNRYLN